MKEEIYRLREQIAADTPRIAELEAALKDALWLVEDLFDRVKKQPKIDTSVERVEKSAKFVQVDWPKDDSRIDLIGQNGGDGLHYAAIRMRLTQLVKRIAERLLDGIMGDGA